MTNYKSFAISLMALAVVMTGCPRKNHSGGNGGGNGGSVDITPPTVTAQAPDINATNVPIDQVITVTFSENMNGATIHDGSFTLKQGSTPILGNVVSNGAIATFTPVSNLASGATFTARVSTAMQDLAGNALASDGWWSFTTGSAAAAGPPVVNLGNAGNFVILAKSTVTTTGTTMVTGDIGLSPADRTYLTGFSEVMDASNVFSTSAGIVTGRLYAADYTPPTPSNLGIAVLDMEAAYTDAETRPTPDFLNLGAGSIEGLTLVPGLYKWGSSVGFTSGVTLSGAANDVWIFQIDGDLVAESGAIVTIVGGQARNVFWQVAGQTILKTTSDFKGIILCKTQIVLQTGAIMNGRALAQTAVTLDATAISNP